MKTRNILMAIVGVLVLLAIAGVFQTISALGKPLGPRLVLELKPADNASTSTAIAHGGAVEQAEASAGVCNNAGSMVILGIGFDQTVEDPFGADTIRYIKADFDTPAITVVALPRDLWLQTAALAEQNISETTAGKLFYYSYQGTSGGIRHQLVTASTDLNQTLYDSFSIIPDNYATMELSSMTQLIDTVGGVDVNIPEAITVEGVTFQPGEQHLDGHQAMLYMRALPVTSSEWERFSRQDLVLIALYNKLLTPAILPKLGELIRIYHQSFVTDLSTAEAMDLACLIQTVSLENIQFKEIGPEMVSPGPEGSMLPNIPVITEFLRMELGQ
jgi:LCP family protein required for cell wall assembly